VRITILMALAAAGCSFHTSSGAPDANKMIDSRIIDGPIDAAIDAPPDGPQVDFGDGTFVVHLSMLPTASVTLPGMINTDTSTLCGTTATWMDASQPTDTCFIVGTDIKSGGGTTTVTGSKPLVLVATGMITITQKLDVSSNHSTTTGAGGNYALCPAYPQNPDPDGNGGGGGAGGGFTTKGNDGGDGNNGSAQKGLAAAAAGTPTFLRGGCAGQKAGNGTAGNPGNGGGALYLVAGASISIGNTINASGGGGVHGTDASGGSGGGSGGMIVLYAPMITATASVQVFANGGGGASGGDSNMSGHNGTDGGNPMGALMAGAGSMGAGGNGGDGAIVTAAATTGGGGLTNEGGGGGGGGLGYIRSNIDLTGAIVSPSVDVVP
jgi:hypothetical protein